jgi:hypothetical protein
VRQNVEDSSGEIHDAETMLETFVRGGRIDEPGKGELVNMAKALERARIDNLPFVGRQYDESVNRITEFIVFLRHDCMVAVTNTGSEKSPQSR